MGSLQWSTRHSIQQTTQMTTQLLQVWPILSNQLRRCLHHTTPHQVLVLNCGSSSIKFQVIVPSEERCLLSGQADRLNSSLGKLKWKLDGDTSVESLASPSYEEVVDRIFNIVERVQFDCVGHRVVHGGEVFKHATVMTADTIEKLSGVSSLAPLHNPVQTQVIRMSCDRYPSKLQGAVFDTSYHSHMPPHSYLYGVPLQWYHDYHVRRYGFHGPSHQYVTQQTSKLLGRPLSDLAIVSCHLGAGCSIAATLGGVSKDTSMGFSPLEGLVMGQRCGDVDPSIVHYMATKLQVRCEDILEKLNTQSGFLGIAGTPDSRDLEDRHEAGDDTATLAIEMYCYRVAKYIASYSVPLGRIDAIVFTGGIGEKSFIKRKKILDYLAHFDISYDEEANNENGKNTSGLISTAASKVDVLVVATNEELMIAKEIEKLLTK